MARKKKLSIIIGRVVIVISILIIISRYFGVFENTKVKANDKEIFSVTDLTVGKLKFSDTEKEVKKALGKPKKEETITKDIYKYKIFYYNGLKLTLKENYDDYILVGSEITSRRYKTSRKVRVGNQILKVIKKYKVENTNGTYIYGNYTVEALDSNNIGENVYMGLRNTQEIVYINKDASIEGKKSNVARLNFSYSHGRVKKITWSYDFE
jgi:hypothetical protein